LSEEHNKFMKSATHKKMHDFFFFFPQKWNSDSEWNIS
jgi:hypothetical protein